MPFLQIQRPLLQPNMSSDKDDTVNVYQHYCPPGVKHVLASGSSAFIGEVDDSTVFKYPLAPGGDMTRLEVERKILGIVGPHKRIIALKSSSDTGLYLERAVNGTLADYILESENPPHQASSGWSGAERPPRSSPSSTRDACFTAISSRRTCSSTRISTSSSRISRAGTCRRAARCSSTAGAVSPVDSIVPGTTPSTLMSRRISLRLGARSISS